MDGEARRQRGSRQMRHARAWPARLAAGSAASAAPGVKHECALRHFELAYISHGAWSRVRSEADRSLTVETGHIVEQRVGYRRAHPCLEYMSTISLPTSRTAPAPGPAT